jgi:predicted transcriptional regulator
MKRIDDNEMNQMLENGMMQRDIARHFGVTEQAVSKRLKQLKAYQEPESFSKLTQKQKMFVLAKAEGKNNTDAAMAAFECKDRASGKALGHKHMKDPDVAVAIQDLLHQEGVGRRKRVQRLKDMILCPDLTVVGRGLEMANRMAGEYTEKHEFAINEAHILKLILALEGDPIQEREAIDDDVKTLE